MTTEEESTTPVAERTEQVEEAAPVEQDEEFQNTVDTETGEEDAQDAEGSESEDKEEIEAGTSDATPDDVASPTSAATGTALVANKPTDEDRRADVETQPYQFEKCTVQIAVQFLSEDGDEKGRPVLLGVRTHLDAPIVRVLRLTELGELPPSITALVEQLKSELPAREQATKEQIEKEKLESLQRRLKTAKPPRHPKPATPEKPKTLQAAAAPARTVLTANQRANAVTQAVDEKQQLAMF